MHVLTKSRAAHVRSVYRGGRAGRLDEAVYSRTGRGGECAWSRMWLRARGEPDIRRCDRVVTPKVGVGDSCDPDNQCQ